MAEDKNMDPENAKELANQMGTAAEQVKTFSKEAEEAGQHLISLSTHIGNVAKGSKEFTGEIKSAQNLTKQVSKYAADISKFTADDLKDKKKTNALLRKQAAVKGSIQAIESKIAVLMEKAANASEKEAHQLQKSAEALGGSLDNAKVLLKTFDKIEETNEQLNKNTKFFDTLSDFTKDIPVIGKLFSDFKNGADAARKAGVEGKNVNIAGFKQIAKAGVKAAAVFAGSTIFAGFKEGNERITQLSRNLNMSREEAKALNDRFNKLGAATKSLTGIDVLKANSAISSQFGVQADLSNDTLVTISTMTKKLGLSAEEAGTLAKFSASTGQELKGVTEGIIEQVKFQNISNKSAIRYQDVMKDVAGASAATQLTTSKFPGGIAKAAYQARKLGLSFSQLDSAGSNLLDFESSIANEMEAELMLGRDINLDKARAAALSGDQATLAAELAREMGSAEEFGALNVLQQNALAKAMGMSREEVAETLQKQEAITKLGGDQSKGLDAAVRKRYAEVAAMKDGAAKQAAMAKLTEDAGNKELLRQLENKSLAEAQYELQQQMKESVQGLGDPLNAIAAAFSKMSEASGTILTIVGAIGALSIFGKFRGLLKTFKSLTKGAKGLKKILGMGGKAVSKTVSKTVAKTGTKTAVKAAGKIGAKAVGKSLLKKIPIIGALAGVGFAISRAAKGDYAGAALELASGAASIIPGIGTAASVAIDAGLAARDISKATSRGPEATEGTVGDFTLKPLGEDTITMAGGTKLGGNVEKLLEQLISIVSNGGDVYLDGAKVGQTLVLNSKLSN